LKRGALRSSLAAAASCAVLVVPSVASAQTQTASGFLAGVSAPGFLEAQNANGTVTTCEVVFGVLVTPSGQKINFSVGGVFILQPDGSQVLDPQTAGTLAVLSTGLSVESDVVTLNYAASETVTVCNDPLANFVVSASLINTAVGGGGGGAGGGGGRGVGARELAALEEAGVGVAAGRR
jgi:hypothetical protein